jgi:hypothetical protein
MLVKSSFGVWKFMKTGFEVWGTKHVFEKFAKTSNFKPFCFSYASLKWENLQHKCCIYFQYDQFGLKVFIILSFNEKVMGT